MHYKRKGLMSSLLTKYDCPSFGEQLTVRVPSGMQAALTTAAGHIGISMSEFIRRALIETLEDHQIAWKRPAGNGVAMQ